MANLDQIISYLGDDKIVKGTISGSTGVNSGTATSVATITLPPGRWLVIFNAGYGANGTGYREASTGETYSNSRYNTVVPTAGSTTGLYTRVQNIRTFDLTDKTDNTVIHGYANQNSGAKLDVQPVLIAIRL